MKLTWTTNPAVSVNRNFFTTWFENEIYHVVCGVGGWQVQRNHNTIEHVATAKEGKKWLEGHLNYILRTRALSEAINS